MILDAAALLANRAARACAVLAGVLGFVAHSFEIARRARDEAAEEDEPETVERCGLCGSAACIDDCGAQWGDGGL